VRRLLFLLFLALAVFWWLGRLLGATRRGAAVRKPPGRGEALRGRMVRDRVCNTFIPEERALRVQNDGEEHFFCSEACRDRFLAGKGA